MTGRLLATRNARLNLGLCPPCYQPLSTASQWQTHQIVVVLGSLCEVLLEQVIAQCEKSHEKLLVSLVNTCSREQYQLLKHYTCAKPCLNQVQSTYH